MAIEPVWTTKEEIETNVKTLSRPSAAKFYGLFTYSHVNALPILRYRGHQSNNTILDKVTLENLYQRTHEEVINRKSAPIRGASCIDIRFVNNSVPL